MTEYGKDEVEAALNAPDDVDELVEKIVAMDFDVPPWEEPTLKEELSETIRQWIKERGR